MKLVNKIFITVLMFMVSNVSNAQFHLLVHNDNDTIVIPTSKVDSVSFEMTPEMQAQMKLYKTVKVLTCEKDASSLPSRDSTLVDSLQNEVASMKEKLNQVLQQYEKLGEKLTELEQQKGDVTRQYPTGFNGTYRMSPFNDVNKGYTIEFLANCTNNVEPDDLVRYVSIGWSSSGVAMYVSRKYALGDISVLGVNVRLGVQDDFAPSRYPFKYPLHIVICVPPVVNSANTENVRVYINGEKKADKASEITARYTQLTIGGDNSGVNVIPDRWFHHVNLFEGCLSDEECIAMYNNHSPHTYNLPYKYYDNSAENALLCSFYAANAFKNKIYNRANNTYIDNVNSSGNVIYDFDWERPRLLTSKELNILVMGDSISTDAYYDRVTMQLFNAKKYVNIAVAGATWADHNDTTYYNGVSQSGADPNLGGQVSSLNVLGNQLEEIKLRTQEGGNLYGFVPDIIWIAAGTNDGLGNYSKDDEGLNSFFFDSNGWIKMGTAWTDDDNYVQQRKTIAGAMRYVCTNLRLLFPNARVYICTPIQRCNKDNFQVIFDKQTLISNVAKRLALPVIHVGEESGIYADFENGSGGTENGRGSSYTEDNCCLGDGLHPTTNKGRIDMGTYIYKHIMEDFCKIKKDFIIL